MNHTIRIDFHDEFGHRAGELVNAYRLVESHTSRVGIAVEIDMLHEDSVDVLVFHGDNMVLHRVEISQIIGVDEVFV